MVFVRIILPFQLNGPNHSAEDLSREASIRVKAVGPGLTPQQPARAWTKSAAAGAGSSNPGPSQKGGQSQPPPIQARPALAAAEPAGLETISDDYILLCFRVRRYLTLRHDLGVIRIDKDRQLFRAFREQYEARFSWIQRRFSLYSVQRMHFIRVQLILTFGIQVLTLFHSLSCANGTKLMESKSVCPLTRKPTTLSIHAHPEGFLLSEVIS